VIYYAPTIMGFAGFTSATVAILATAGVGAVNAIMTIVAMFLVDRLGRRPLLIGGMIGMAIALFILGLAFALPAFASELGGVTVVTLMIYIGAFAIGLGPVFWLIISEIYPQNVRGKAMGLATTVNWGTNLLVSITFLTLVNLIHESGVFWLYGVLTVAALWFTFARVPETKGKTLEQIQASWRTQQHQRGRAATPQETPPPPEPGQPAGAS
jgi:MFS family permease